MSHESSSKVFSGSDPSNRDTMGYIASGNEGVGTVVHIQEQVDQLQKIVSGLNASVVGVGSVAKVTFSTALNVKK